MSNKLFKFNYENKKSVFIFKFHHNSKFSNNTKIVLKILWRNLL